MYKSVQHTYRLILALVSVSLFSSNTIAAPMLDQSYTPSVGCCFGIGQGVSGGAQTFTVGKTGLLASFEITLDNVLNLGNGIDGNVTFEIRDSSFTTSLFSASLAKNTLTGMTDYAFDVTASNILVSIGDMLAIVIEETGEGAIGWAADFGTNATYAGGESCGGFGSSYSCVSSRDGAFKTYVDTMVTVPEPSTLALFAFGIAGLSINRRLKK